MYGNNPQIQKISNGFLVILPIRYNEPEYDPIETAKAVAKAMNKELNKDELLDQLKGESEEAFIKPLKKEESPLHYAATLYDAFEMIRVYYL